jgi:large subunit ribosomal protein L10
MARATKVAAVDELTEQFRGANAAVLTEYRGLTVSQLKELRHNLGTNATYAIVKNTLTKIAAREAGYDDLGELLQGPSAIAFVQGDAVEAARGLRDFARTHPFLVIKGGVLDGRPLSPSEITRLADVEPREVLLARLAGAMTASLSQAAALFQAPLSQAARAIEALRQQRADAAADTADAGSTSEAAAQPNAEAGTDTGTETGTEAETATAAQPEPATAS